MLSKPSNQPHGFKSCDCLAAIAAIEADILQLTRGLTEGQFHAPGKSGGWSIGFCLEHLVLTGHDMLQRWDGALQQAIGHKPPALSEYPYSLWQRYLLWRLEPPYHRRIKAKLLATPTTRRTIDETIRRFSCMHKEFARRIQCTATLNAAGKEIQSPFAPWVRYPMGFSFDLTLAHERRHLWQAWQVRRQF